MPAFLVVRATVADPGKRAAFDDWYRHEHLADAMKVFGAEKAWRFWSDTDPSAHQATYQVADRAAAEAALNSAGMKALVARVRPRLAGHPAHAGNLHPGGRALTAPSDAGGAALKSFMRAQDRCTVQVPEQRSSPERPAQRPLP